MPCGFSRTREVPPSLFVNLTSRWFLFITALAITRHEANAKNKYVFVNFALLFGISLLGALGSSWARKVSSAPRIRLCEALTRATTSPALTGFFLAFAVVYLSIDALFREFKTATKYAIALGIVGSFFVIYFHGYLTDPKYAYTTQDVRDWKDMITVAENEVAKTGEMPGPEQLAGMMEMYVYQQGERVATLRPDARAERIAEIYPYLHADNVSVFSQSLEPLHHLHVCALHWLHPPVLRLPVHERSTAGGVYREDDVSPPPARQHGNPPCVERHQGDRVGEFL